MVGDGWETGGAAFIIICPLPGSSDCASYFFCSVGLHFEAGKGVCVGGGGRAGVVEMVEIVIVRK